jgi:plastocyanin
MAKLRIAPVAHALGLLLAGCGGGDDGGSASNDTPTTEAGGQSAAATVELKDLKFNPDKVAITTGETVEWVWKENVLHNVTGDGFKSDNISDGPFRHTFTKAGTFDYHCTLHSGMTGTVEVS